jgi:hypothetical protein
MEIKMELENHSLKSLFEQLGLEGSEEAIEKFIKNNSPLPSTVELHEAKFWTKSQSSFLLQSKKEDAEWAIVVDQLNEMLRK